MVIPAKYFTHEIWVRLPIRTTDSADNGNPLLIVTICMQIVLDFWSIHTITVSLTIQIILRHFPDLNQFRHFGAASKAMFWFSVIIVVNFRQHRWLHLQWLCMVRIIDVVAFPAQDLMTDHRHISGGLLALMSDHRHISGRPYSSCWFPLVRSCKMEEHLRRVPILSVFVRSLWIGKNFFGLSFWNNLYSSVWFLVFLQTINCYSSIYDFEAAIVCLYIKAHSIWCWWLIISRIWILRMWDVELLHR